MARRVLFVCHRNISAFNKEFKEIILLFIDFFRVGSFIIIFLFNRTFRFNWDHFRGVQPDLTHKLYINSCHSIFLGKRYSKKSQVTITLLYSGISDISSQNLYSELEVNKCQVRERKKSEFSPLYMLQIAYIRSLKCINYLDLYN